MGEEDVVAELYDGFGLPGEHGLSQLKIGGDAGLMIAELCYHLRYDESTNDLWRISTHQLFCRM
jgi:hypothetical protein